MTDSANNDTNNPPSVPETGAASARIRRTPWRGWLMAVPLAAMILVGYLVIRTWIFSGPTITVTFPRSAGISAQGTVVKYKGLKVGKVKSVKLVDHLHKVRATLNMDDKVADALNSGTQFWIVSPSIFSGDIQSLLNGPHIAMRPGKGSPKSHFKGKLHPPNTPAGQSGRVVDLAAQNKGSLGRGSLVIYHGIQAGHVLTTKYNTDHDRIDIRAWVKQPFAAKLSQQSRFWRAGGFGIQTGQAGISIKTPGIKELLSGGIAFANVGKPKPNKSNTSGQKLNGIPKYTLFTSKSAAQSALAGPHHVFSLRPPNGLDGIQTGAAVTLKGQTIGRVTSVNMRYDTQASHIRTELEVKIYAQALGLSGQPGQSQKATAKSPLVNALDHLIKQGLRAKLASSIPIVGGTHIELVMTHRHNAKGLENSHNPPGIPTIAGGGLGDVVDKLNNVADKIDAMPLEQIGQNLKHATAQANKLASSPQIRNIISNLNHSLANVEDISAGANGQIKPTLKSLRQAAAAAHQAMQKIKQLTAGDADNKADLQRLVGEVTRAARSIRVLTNYLQQHPEALIRGRDH